MTLIVYRQAEPIPTGDTFTKRDEYGQPIGRGDWCRANLVKVGEVETWAEAKGLCVAPVCEVKRP